MVMLAMGATNTMGFFNCVPDGCRISHGKCSSHAVVQMLLRQKIGLLDESISTSRAALVRRENLRTVSSTPIIRLAQHEAASYCRHHDHCGALTFGHEVGMHGSKTNEDAEVRSAGVCKMGILLAATRKGELPEVVGRAAFQRRNHLSSTSLLLLYWYSIIRIHTSDIEIACEQLETSTVSRAEQHMCVHDGER
nr:hypothetical protein CFP56_60282 [Quercus suber]